MTEILVVDDEKAIRFAFEKFLQDEGFSPRLAADAEAAMDQIHSQKPEIVFLDYRLPGKDGLALLTEIKKMDDSIPVVFMTAFGEMEVAIKAMQQGAYEYLTKPLDLNKIRVLISRILAGKKSLKDIPSSADLPDPRISSDQMVGKGQAMQEIFKMIGLLTIQDVTVFITGESGVGKERVARAIHDNSRRCIHPFVAVNCGAMPVNLIEAELFGYEKGAFAGPDAPKLGKFETASQGTIFLDDIDALHPALQVKLLRVLQEKLFERVGGNTPVRTEARIIASTNKDIQEEVEMGNFRKDLFYRLHLIHIHLPPLRERKEDIPALIDYFIRKANLEMNRRVRRVTEEAMKRLESYPWPGNIGELENQIKRAIALSREDVLPDYLFEIPDERISSPHRENKERLIKMTRQYFAEILEIPDASHSPFDQVTDLVAKTVIEEALQRTDGNQVQASQLLGIHRSTLRKKIEDYKIP
jgi:DNA-binding NtrC family response regulator